MNEEQKEEEQKEEKKRRFDIINVIVTLVISSAALVVSIFSVHISNQTALKISSKEYQMSEDLKYDLIEMAAILRSIDNKADFSNFSGQNVDFSYELQSLKSIQSRPGYIVFLNTINNPSDRIEIEDGILKLTDRYLVSDTLRMIDIRMRVQKILLVMAKHTDLKDSMSMDYENLLKKLCSMEFYFRINENDSVLKQISVVKSVEKELMQSGNDDSKVSYYFVLYCDSDSICDNKVFDSINNIIEKENLRFWKEIIQKSKSTSTWSVEAINRLLDW